MLEDLLHERGIDICHETMRFWWNRFGPMFAAEIRRKRSASLRALPQWCWHLDEVLVKINGETHYLWRAVDHEGEVLEVFVTKRRDRKAALRFLRKAMKRYGRPEIIVTDELRSYSAAMKVIGNAAAQECGHRLNNRAENSHQPFRRREGAMAKFRDAKTLQKFASVTVTHSWPLHRHSPDPGLNLAFRHVPVTDNTAPARSVAQIGMGFNMGGNFRFNRLAKQLPGAGSQNLRLVGK